MRRITPHGAPGQGDVVWYVLASLRVEPCIHTAPFDSALRQHATSPSPPCDVAIPSRLHPAARSLRCGRRYNQSTLAAASAYRTVAYEFVPALVADGNPCAASHDVYDRSVHLEGAVHACLLAVCAVLMSVSLSTPTPVYESIYVARTRRCPDEDAQRLAVRLSTLRNASADGEYDVHELGRRGGLLIPHLLPRPHFVLAVVVAVAGVEKKRRSHKHVRRRTRRGDGGGRMVQRSLGRR